MRLPISLIAALLLGGCATDDLCSLSIPKKWDHPPDVALYETGMSGQALRAKHHRCGPQDNGSLTLEACSVCATGFLFCAIDYRNDIPDRDQACVLRGEHARINALRQGIFWDPLQG